MSAYTWGLDAVPPPPDLTRPTFPAGTRARRARFGGRDGRTRSLEPAKGPEPPAQLCRPACGYGSSDEERRSPPRTPPTSAAPAPRRRDAESVAAVPAAHLSHRGVPAPRSPGQLGAAEPSRLGRGSRAAVRGRRSAGLQHSPMVVMTVMAK